MGDRSNIELSGRFGKIPAKTAIVMRYRTRKRLFIAAGIRHRHTDFSVNFHPLRDYRIILSGKGGHYLLAARGYPDPEAFACLTH